MRIAAANLSTPKGSCSVPFWESAKPSPGPPGPRRRALSEPGGGDRRRTANGWVREAVRGGCSGGELWTVPDVRRPFWGFVSFEQGPDFGAATDLSDGGVYGLRHSDPSFLALTSIFYRPFVLGVYKSPS